MQTKTMSLDDKFNHYAVGTLLLLLATPIAALGIGGIHFALTSYDAAPGLESASLFVTLVGGAAITLAIVCIRHAWKTPLRPY